MTEAVVDSCAIRPWRFAQAIVGLPRRARFLNKIEMISERIVHGVNLQYLGELGRLRVENDRSLLPSPSP